MIEDIRLGEAMSKTIVEFKDIVKTYGSGDALLYAVNHIDFKYRRRRICSHTGTVWCR